MFIKLFLITSFILIPLLLPANILAQTTQHPFLLVNQNQYTTLQTKANLAPFSAMKSSAINSCRTLNFPCSGNHSFCIKDIMSACSLAYILDPAFRNDYLNKVISTMPGWESVIIVQSGADDGTRNSSNEYYTHSTAAFFNTVLAIDIMHDDLAVRSFSSPHFNFTNQLAYAEFLMEQEFNHFYGITRPVYDFVNHIPDALAYHSPSRHPPAREAIMILWKVYKGEFNSNDNDSRALLFGGMLANNYPDPDGDGKNIEGYIPEMDARINDSGVYSEGSSYAHAAWGLDRDDRSHLIDVLEFTGKDVEFGVDFYTNEKYKNFYEWLYGYASTPFGMMTSFGDTYAFRRLIDDGNDGSSFAESTHIGQAGIFSQAAGSYALWKSRGVTPIGKLVGYLLYTNNNSSLRPQSRIFTNGGGFFMENNANDNSLYGAIWNVKKPVDGSPVFHVRKDVNAIYVAGYGEPLLMNGGFCGSSSPAGPDSCSGRDPTGAQIRFPGSYLGDRAVSNNVALVNYSIGNYLDPNPDNNLKFGGGVLEGFTSDTLDYVSATSLGLDGSALAGGTQQRNFFFVKPSSNSNGYFVLFDEFTGLSNGNVNLVFHPNTNGPQTIANLTEYNNPVGQKVNSTSTAGLSLFFATQPSSIQFQKGIIATAGSIGAYVPDYFFNTYNVVGNTKNIATILFPYDAAHQKANISRISGTSYTGATIDHGSGAIDLAIGSWSDQSVMQGGADFQGSATIFRKINNSLTFYFVRKGKVFGYGNPKTGFDSANDLSIFMHGTEGQVVSALANSLTINYPGVTSIRVDGVLANITGQGIGWLRINLPPGSHAISLGVNGATPRPQEIQGDANGDNKVDGIDYMIWMNHYDQSITGNSVGDFDGSGRVDNRDLTIWLDRY